MAKDCESCSDDTCAPVKTLVDFATGRPVPDTRAERVRQKTEQFLVKRKEYSKSDLQLDVEFTVTSGGVTYNPAADLIVTHGGKRAIIITCVYGSLLPVSRLTLSYARLLCDYQIPLVVVTNGIDTDIIDTHTGEVIATGIDAVPSKDELAKSGLKFIRYPQERVEKEKRVLAAFESIDETTCPNVKNE